MLADHPINPVLLAEDLPEAKRFYHDVLGLPLLSENEKAITLATGGNVLSVTSSPVGTADEQTQASWRVTHVRAEVAELRERGVQFDEYDQPGFATDQDGVVDIGFALAAYFSDPGKNALSILQVK